MDLKKCKLTIVVRIQPSCPIGSGFALATKKIIHLEELSPIVSSVDISKIDDPELISLTLFYNRRISEKLYSVWDTYLNAARPGLENKLSTQHKIELLNRLHSESGVQSKNSIIKCDGTEAVSNIAAHSINTKYSLYSSLLEKLERYRQKNCSDFSGEL